MPLEKSYANDDELSCSFIIRDLLRNKSLSDSPEDTYEAGK